MFLSELIGFKSSCILHLSSSLFSGMFSIIAIRNYSSSSRTISMKIMFNSIINPFPCPPHYNDGELAGCHQNKIWLFFSSENYWLSQKNYFYIHSAMIISNKHNCFESSSVWHTRSSAIYAGLLQVSFDYFSRNINRTQLYSYYYSKSRRLFF